MLRRQRPAPHRQQAGQFAGVLVVFRPLKGFARFLQLVLIVRVGAVHTARLERLQRALRPLAAVDACRPEKHDRVLDLLAFETAERFEVLGQEADRTRLVAVKKLLVLVRERLLRHSRQFTTSCGGYSRPSAPSAMMRLR